MAVSSPDPAAAPWRHRLYTVIFEADTPAGRTFDLVLIVAIVASVVAVILDSVAVIHAEWHDTLLAIEWFFTALFTVEYVLRLIAVRRPGLYALSFFGIIDLLAIAPTWASLLIPGAHYFLTVRTLRLLRIFRVLKLTEYIAEAGFITSALRASARKIFVFLFAVLTLVVIIGALAYVVEGPENGYLDIPTSMYWAIVTLTTVGYGDISPQTPLGKFLAALVMIMGYAIIAVPTGIVTSEMAVRRTRPVTERRCGECGRDGHELDALHCKYCGAAIAAPARA